MRRRVSRAGYLQIIEDDGKGRRTRQRGVGTLGCKNSFRSSYKIRSSYVLGLGSLRSEEPAAGGDALEPSEAGGTGQFREAAGVAHHPAEAALIALHRRQPLYRVSNR